MGSELWADKMTIDSYLDSYASESIADGKNYRWWWNGCDVLSDAIESLCIHVLVDGCHMLTDTEVGQLERLAHYMGAYPEFGDVGAQEELWFHAEAMWLLGRWFSRLWD